MAKNFRLMAVVAIVLSLSLSFARDAAAQSLLERLEKRLGDAGVPVPSTPAPPKPNLVERLQQPAEPAARGGYLGLTADSKNGGIEVLSVRAGGPADNAGVKPGDRIVSVGGAEVANLDEMGAIVEKVPTGSRVDMVVSRGGREQKVAITVAARDPAPAEALPSPLEEEMPEERALDQPRASLGVRALPVTTDLQRRYGLVVRRGAVIEFVQPGSPADRYGLPIGAAITAVDGVRIESPDDLADFVAAARPGDTIEVSYYQRDQVFRKDVKLTPAGSGVVAPAPGEDRPLLRRLERAFEQPPLVGNGAVAELQAQVDAMAARIESLETRIRQLEAKLSAGTQEDEKAPAKEPTLSPPLKPLEP